MSRKPCPLILTRMHFSSPRLGPLHLIDGSPDYVGRFPVPGFLGWRKAAWDARDDVVPLLLELVAREDYLVELHGMYISVHKESIEQVRHKDNPCALSLLPSESGPEP